MHIFNYNSFVELVRNKCVSVLGIGISNIPLIKILIEAGAKITARDKRDILELEREIQNFESQGVKLICGDKYLKDLKEEVIFKSPGIPFNSIAKLLNENQILTSEMEIFCDLCTVPIIAITGSDGKTTTSTLVDLILRKYNLNTYLGGNIGTPLLPQINQIKIEDKVVLELSSFQLQAMNHFRPKVAVITNVTPNHLDHHLNLEEYVYSKKNILKNQSKTDFLILNYDNYISQNFYNDSKAKTLFFSTKSRDVDCFLENNFVKLNLSNTLVGRDQIIPILDVSKIKLPGIHNIENYMAAILTISVSIEGFNRHLQPIVETAENFIGVEHRLEFVREIEGIYFYNDSASSTPARTIAALNSFNTSVILIAGGYDKNIEFDELALHINQKVKSVILIGNTKNKIKYELEKIGYSNFIIADALDEAVKLSKKIAITNDKVLFSPACASFDMFQNAHHRGRIFKELISQL